MLKLWICVKIFPPFFLLYIYIFYIYIFVLLLLLFILIFFSFLMCLSFYLKKNVSKLYSNMPYKIMSNNSNSSFRLLVIFNYTAGKMSTTICSILSTYPNLCNISAKSNSPFPAEFSILRSTNAAVL